MIVLWLVAGSLMVSVPYYIFYDPYNLWSSVYAGGIGAAVYLIALVLFFIMKEKTKSYKIVVAGFTALLFVTSYSHWTTMDSMTSWQRSRLRVIRATIGCGIFQDEDVTERALPVFVAYQKQKEKKKKIVPLFTEMFGSKIQNGFFSSSDTEYNPTKRFVRYDGDTSVVLISIDTVARGLQSGFQNRNGSVGRLQITTSLSARGVHYERNN